MIWCCMCLSYTKRYMCCTVIFVLSIYLYMYIWALRTCDHVCEHVCICLHVCAFMSEDNLCESVPLLPSAWLDQIQVVMLDGSQQYSLIYTTTIMIVSLFIFVFESKEAFVNNTQAWSLVRYWILLSLLLEDEKSIISQAEDKPLQIYLLQQKRHLQSWKCAKVLAVCTCSVHSTHTFQVIIPYGLCEKKVWKRFRVNVTLGRLVQSWLDIILPTNKLFPAVKSNCEM